MRLPETFLCNIRNSFGAQGERWLADLPELLNKAARRWDLSLGEPFLLSYNYVCAATRADGSAAVLKIGVPNREIFSEMAALRLFDGAGACRLLAADDENCTFLLERLFPGQMLVSLADDEARTQIACQVMTRLWRPAPPELPFIPLSAWFAELDQLRPRYGGATGPFPGGLVARVESLLPDLLHKSNPVLLIHGDFHHFNVLNSERGWLAIDPKGVLGPPGYEVGPFLINPWDELLKAANPLEMTERRLSILSEQLGLPAAHLRDWGLSHCLLSAWWDTDESGRGGEYPLACAELLARARL
ncbi:MAG: aminoglycoside phosphotransferase family protein [Anaerolineales bacterium]|jgi:streptomycin 6-kinase|nr:aminoglycoside phosphotransferase family protein [Anaerolineales bacterium]